MKTGPAYFTENLRINSSVPSQQNPDPIPVAQVPSPESGTPSQTGAFVSPEPEPT